MGSIAPAALVTPHIPIPGSSQGNALQARADTAYATEWDVQEQATLDAALARYPADRHPPLERYVRAAAGLPKKNVRDVALRVAWMRATAAARKRKAADEANSKKQVRRERGQSIFAVQPKTMGGGMGPHLMAQHSMGLGMGVAPAAQMGMVPGMPMPGSNMMQPPGMAYAQPVVPMAPPLVSQLDDHGAGTVGVVGGPLSQLLEQNYAILNQFKQNMEVYKVNENTELLVRFRDNILTVLNQMNAMQGVMQQMPPLPVRLNVELANNFLPKAVANGVCQMPYMAAPMHGMPPMPVTGQQGSAAMQQASMPYAAASAPPPGFAAAHMAPQPVANGVSAPAPAPAAPVGQHTAQPTSMPAASMPQGGVPGPGMPGMGGLPAQAAAVKQEPASQAQPAQGPVSIKLEPGLPALGSMAMPMGPAASAALFRPPMPLASQPLSTTPMGGVAAVMPSTNLAVSTALPAAHLIQHQHQLQQAQQQQLQQRGPPIPATLTDPAKTPYNMLFPSSSAGQAAPAQEPGSSAGGLYDVLASITANTPGMLQPSASQAFSTPQPASATPAAAAQASQPQPSAAPAAGVQSGLLPAGRPAAGAPLPYSVVQTGHLQPGAQELQSMARSQAIPLGPPNSVVVPAPLPPSQSMPASAPHPYTAQVQGQMAMHKAPAAPSVPMSSMPQAPQQQQQFKAPASAAAPSPSAAAAPAVVAPQSRPVAEPAAPPAGSHGAAQSPGNSNPPQPASKVAPNQMSQPPAAPLSRPVVTSGPVATPAKGTAAATKPAASAPLKGAAAPAQAAQPAPVQQPASKAAAAPAASAAAAQQEKPAPAASNAATVSPQRARPNVGTRSSSALSPGRPQRATRSTAAKR
ncbi:g1002 [Coccomyxa viridis]|uniref:G1002 protein n=1 Tax=Coccomyxa viridis TaxID=1274662 RepID=A0ABP1FH58_9CHLO